MRAAFAVIAATVAVATAFPNPAVNFKANVFLNVSQAGGFNTVYNGVFNQDTYVFSGSYEDDTGYIFQEVYKLDDQKKCTNYEVHGNQCELGCNAGQACQSHSCSCGAAMGVFEYLSGAKANGNCGPAQAGQKYTATVAHTDDDYARAQTIDFCFDKDAPIFIYKKYTTSETHDFMTGIVRKLAPEHIRVEEVTVRFNSWFPMQADPKAFVEPKNCQC